MPSVTLVRSEALAERDVIGNKPQFLGYCLDAMGLQQPREPLQGIFVLGVVVVRQHRSAHVPLEVIQRQVAPLSTSGVLCSCEPSLLVQCDAASVGKVSELMHDEGDSPLEVLDKFSTESAWTRLGTDGNGPASPCGEPTRP